MARMTSTAMVRNIQARRGMRASVIPRQRMDRMVAMMLTAVPMLPNPETRSDSVQ